MKTSSAVVALVGVLALGACKGEATANEASSTVAVAAVEGAVDTSATLQDNPEDGDLVGTDMAGDAPIYGPDHQVIKSAEISGPFPVAFQKWEAGVDALNANLIYWVRSLDGTQKDLTMVNVSGQSYIKGYVCEVRACGMNEVLYLMRPDQSRMVGIAKLDEDGPSRKEYLIGNPTRDEVQCLRYYLANEDDNSACADPGL